MASSCTNIDSEEECDQVFTDFKAVSRSLGNTNDINEVHGASAQSSGSDTTIDEDS